MKITSPLFQVAFIVACLGAACRISPIWQTDTALEKPVIFTVLANMIINADKSGDPNIADHDNQTALILAVVNGLPIKAAVNK
jgi:hypothetical protein